MNKFEVACREWLKGCSCSSKDNQEECKECTKAFHNALRNVVEREVAPTDVRSLFNSYKKYIKLLEDEIVEIKHIAHEHGWKTTRFEAGKILRKEIKQLEKRIS